jgi:hypothetical protein
MFSKSVLGACTLAMSLAASAISAAQPVTTELTAAKKAGEPPTKPLAFVICAFEGDNAGQKCAALGGSPAYIVPSNRTYIIEQVTGFCTGAESTSIVVTVDLIVMTAGMTVDHLLIGSKPEGPGFQFQFSDDTRLYADPGSTITLGIAGIPADDGGRLCRFAFSGRLVR